MSNWNCPNCNEELGELNAYCLYCKIEDNLIIYNPDKYFIREIRINHIVNGEKLMTPQEELFAQLFNHEKLLVKDMDTLTLRAHREELAKIAFEARARLTAVDDEDNQRNKKGEKGKGFAKSINTDETTTNAINTIKERKAKLSAKEKMLQNLIDLYVKGGMSRNEAEKVATGAMGAGKILEQIKKKENPDSADKKFEASVKNETVKSSKEQEEKKPFVNPFQK